MSLQLRDSVDSKQDQFTHWFQLVVFQLVVRLEELWNVREHLLLDSSEYLLLVKVNISSI